TEARQISSQICFEFVEKYHQLSFVELPERWNLCGIGDLCSGSLHLVDQSVHELIDGVVEAEIFSDNSDACVFRSIGIEKFRIVGLNFPWGCSRGFILGVCPSHCTK